MHKVITILSILILSAFIGCSKQNEPQSITKNYYQSVLDSDYNQAYQYLSNSDQQAYSLDQYVKMKSDSLNPILRSLSKKTEFSIKEINTNNSEATVTLDISSPDIKAMIGDLFMTAFGGNLADTSKIEENISEMIEEHKIQYKKSEKAIELVLEDNGWKVFEGLQAKKRRQEATSTANTLISSAEELITNQNFTEAESKLNEVLSIDEKYLKESIIQNAESMIAKIEIIESLELYDIVSRYIDTYLDDEEAGIRFKIKNNSNHDLSKVAVKVYYLNSEDSIIFERTLNPVLVTEFSFGDNEPLKAGYIYQMPDRQFYTSDSVPDEWDEGEVIVSISDVEIMD